MPLQELLQKSYLRLREQGPRSLWRRVHAHVHDSYRDRLLGVETVRLQDRRAARLNLPQEDYEPLSYWHLEKLLSAFTITPGNDVFLDYGSGKGRIVAVAAMRPFRQVIGIEIQDGLNEIARQNLELIRPKLTCRDVSVLTADATIYELPHDVTHLFLFNPFEGPVLEAALERIHDSWESSPRTIQIAYVVPKSYENLLEQCRWLNRTHRLPLPHWAALEFLIYTTQAKTADVTGKRE